MPHRIRNVALSVALYLTLSITANGSRFDHVECLKIGTDAAHATCSIHLAGEVKAEEYLYISEVNDSESLSFEGIKLGSTGKLMGREYYARPFPRVYSLDLIEGVKDPTLVLKASSLYSKDAGIPGKATIEVINKKSSFLKANLGYGTSVVELFVLLGMIVWTTRWFRIRVRDGWSYPEWEFKWFFGCLTALAANQLEIVRFLNSILFQNDQYQLLLKIISIVYCWSLGITLLNARFKDRSSSEGRAKGLGQNVESKMVNLAFLGELFLVTLPQMKNFHIPLTLYFLPMILFLSLFRTEWRRVFKRSELSAIGFHASLHLLALSALTAYGIQHFIPDSPLKFQTVIWVGSLGIIVWRSYQWLQIHVTTDSMSELLRENWLQQPNEYMRLLQFTNEVQEYTDAARVSLIYVQGEDGLVLASSGPEAISNGDESEPRKLGPILKRVCKEQHLLYAPVAEELQKQFQGIRHSSLAIPVLQKEVARLVLCVMANEDDRIPPLDSFFLEAWVNKLSSELLATAHCFVQRKRADTLFEFGTNINRMNIDHFDDWGKFHDQAESKYQWCALLELINPLSSWNGSSRLSSIEKRFQIEFMAQVTAIRDTFSYHLIHDRTDSFQLFAPQVPSSISSLTQFENLVLITMILQKYSRALVLREDFRALGYSSIRITMAPVKIELKSAGLSGPRLYEPSKTNLSQIYQRRNSAQNPEPVLIMEKDLWPAMGIANPPIHLISKILVAQKLENYEIYSILSESIDKKEYRNFEITALDQMKRWMRPRGAA